MAAKAAGLPLAQAPAAGGVTQCRVVSSAPKSANSVRALLKAALAWHLRQDPVVARDVGRDAERPHVRTHAGAWAPGEGERLLPAQDGRPQRGWQQAGAREPPPAGHVGDFLRSGEQGGGRRRTVARRARRRGLGRNSFASRPLRSSIGAENRRRTVHPLSPALRKCRHVAGAPERKGAMARFFRKKSCRPRGAGVWP
jgi:hypothetical protein